MSRISQEGIAMVFVLSLLATVCDLSVLAAFTIQEKSSSESRVRPGILVAYQRDTPNVPQTRPHAVRNPKSRTKPSARGGEERRTLRSIMNVGTSEPWMQIQERKRRWRMRDPTTHHTENGKMFMQASAAH